MTESRQFVWEGEVTYEPSDVHAKPLGYSRRVRVTGNRLDWMYKAIAQASKRVGQN